MEIVFIIFNNTVSLMIGILLPFLTFIFLFIRWYKKGKDLPVGTILVKYSANENFSNLTTTEIKTISHQKVPINVITSILQDLERLGYLCFEEIKNKSTLEDYKIKILKDIEDDKPEYLRKYFKLLNRHKGKEFLKSDLTSTWKYYDPTEFDKVKESLYKELDKENYFDGNPVKVKDIYLQLGWTLILLGCLLIMIVAFPFSYSLIWLLAPAIGIIVSGIIALIFTPIMPKRTKKGLAALKEFLGFREFFKRVEKPKLLRNSSKSISATTRNEVKQRIKAILPLSSMALGVLLLIIFKKYNLPYIAFGIGFLLFFIGMLTSSIRGSLLNIK